MSLDQTILDISEAIRVLYPSRYNARHDSHKQRFSPLLLEHGEQELQDWGAIVSTFSNRSSTLSSTSNDGMGFGSNLSSQGMNSSANSTAPMTMTPAEGTKGNPRSSRRKESRIKMTNIKGRLRLCSKSILFEPSDISRGIIRLPFDKMIEPPSCRRSANPLNTNANANGANDKTIYMKVRRITIIKKNNIIAPYDHVEKRISFSFTFQHSTTKEFMDLFEQIYQTSSLSSLEKILKPMTDQPFDPSNLVHMNEVPKTNNLRACMLSPLVKTAGCAIVTGERLYFQPFNGVHAAMATKALHWNLADVVATARRCCGLKDEALELFFDEGPSILMAFETYKQREEIYQLLPKKRLVRCHKNGKGHDQSVVPIPCHTDRSFLGLVVDAWRGGVIDNFEYLLALNSAAGRSFLDLSRYPVFPWVLADYSSSKLDLSLANTSASSESGENYYDSAMSNMFRDLTKPIGALNEERLKGFEERYKSMQDDHNPQQQPFLYGTHYSAPGYCLYYLVRTMPEHMLCLQNGKYDAPDRLFHSMSNCYSSLLTNPADIKESIPQFFDAKAGVDMLLNLSGLQLGVTQNGIVLDDIELPKWAKSPKDFLKKNRKALESEYCTRYLPSWIDLIFGVKSRGEQALEAMNVFHPTAYMSPKDLGNMSEEERMQAELQATEFGICPDVLFSASHPEKNNLGVSHSSFISPELERSLLEKDIVSGGNESGISGQWERVSSPVTLPSDSNEGKSSTDVLLTPSTSFNLFGPEKVTWTPTTPTISKEVTEKDEPRTPEAQISNYATADIVEVDMSQFSNGNGNMDKSKTVNLSLRGSGKQRERNNAPRTPGGFGGEEEHRTPQRVIDSSLSSVHKRGFDANKGWAMKHVTSKQMHGGAVSGCCLSMGTDKSFLTTTSLDGGLMVHTLPSSGDNRVSNRRSFISTDVTERFSASKSHETVSQNFHAFRTHHSSDPLACLALVNDRSGGHVAFTGGHDDVVLAYGINSACGLASVYSHRDVVTGLTLIPRSAECKFGTHLMVSSSWDATVKVWGVKIFEGEKVHIHKEAIVEFFDADSSIDSVDALHIQNLGLLIAAGGTDGSLIVWVWGDDGGKKVIYKEESKRRKESCSTLKWSTNWSNGEHVLFAGYHNGRLSSYVFKDSGIYPTSKLNIGSPVQCLYIVPTSHDIFAGCSDGGLRLVTVGVGARFDNEPVLFQPYNVAYPARDVDITVPGLTSISVIPGSGAITKYTVAIGWEDGTVSLYQIQRLPTFD